MPNRVKFAVVAALALSVLGGAALTTKPFARGSQAPERPPSGLGTIRPATAPTSALAEGAGIVQTRAQGGLLIRILCSHGSDY
jgi:hypothetical protein